MSSGYDFYNTSPFNPGIAYYGFDANGNLTSDVNKGIVNIDNNVLNLPQTIDMGNNNLIEFTYDATGKKLRKTCYNNGQLGLVVDYSNGFVYNCGKLDFIIGDEGKILNTNNGFVYEYQIKDHLGNVRVCFADLQNTGNITVTQTRSYYSFGLEINDFSFDLKSNSTPNLYRYNGKEFQEDFGLQWYDYGARFYDTQIGRWTTQDPLAELSRKWSPYTYGKDNPIKFNDPSGMADVDVYGRATHDANGVYIPPSERKSSDYDDDQPQTSTTKREKIAIDPGHGDKNDKNKSVDPGAVNGTDYEKDLVVSIANAVNKLLEQKGYSVTMTRTGDKDNAGTKLQWRIDAADGTDIFVSIHINSSESESAEGFSV